MPSPDSLYQSVGGVTFPIDATEVIESGSLASLDKARTTLTALFAAAINSELTEVWEASTAGTPLEDTLPVQDTFQLQPDIQSMQQRKAGFPLLAVHRAGDARFEEHTLSQDKLIQQWEVDYILGPLDVAAMRRLGDMPRRVADVLRLVIRQRGHRSYQSGAVQFFGDTCGIAAIELQSFQIGQAPFAGDESGTIYYGMTAKLETVELTSDDLGAFGGIDGATFTIDVGDDQGLVPSLIVADTTAPG